jgi:hypothetical protein
MKNYFFFLLSTHTFLFYFTFYIISKLAIKPIVPQLQLPQRLSEKFPRTARKFDDDANVLSSRRGMSADLPINVVTSAEELTALATQLGETFLATDLSCLLNYRTARQLTSLAGMQKVLTHRLFPHVGSVHVLRKGGSQVESIDHVTAASIPTKRDATRLHANYQVKCDILCAIDIILSGRKYLQIMQNPVNLLYCELTFLYKERHQLPVDAALLKQLIFKVLLHYTEQMESNLSQSEEEMNTSVAATPANNNQTNMNNNSNKNNSSLYSLPLTPLTTVKADKFVYRIFSRLQSLTQHSYLGPELDAQLHLLSDYMKFCYTRFTSLQVYHVCIKVLLQIKSIVFSKSLRFASSVHNNNNNNLTNSMNNNNNNNNSNNSSDLWGTLHAIIKVFNRIVKSTTHKKIQNMCLKLFLEDDETYRVIRNYTTQALLNPAFEKRFPDPSGKNSVQHFRIRVIKHFTICTHIITKKMDAAIAKREEDSQKFQKKISELQKYLNRMEFLFLPVRF